MKINDKLKNYTDAEREGFIDSIDFMTKVTHKVKDIYAKEKKKMTEMKGNVIYINPSIQTEFLKLKDTEVSLSEAIGIYRKWYEQLFFLATKNVGNFHVISVQKHCDLVSTICSTFFLMMKELQTD